MREIRNDFIYVYVRNHPSKRKIALIRAIFSFFLAYVKYLL